MIDFLFTVALLELFVGGGGRLVAFGPVSLRMVLFALLLLLTVVVGLLRMRRSDGQVLALGLVTGYLLVHTFALLNGSIQGAELGRMVTEWQQSLYWLMAPCFAMVLQSRHMVLRTAALVKIAGVVLAMTYIAVLLGAALGWINLFSLLKYLADTGEFVSRGESFVFYKGFLYLGIAIIFVVAMRGRRWRILTVVLMVALVMTLTRGFLLSTSLAVLLLLLAQGRKLTFTFAMLGVLLAGFLMLVYLPSLTDGLMSSRQMSNSQRIEDALYIWRQASGYTLAFGEGFGSLINSRPNIENTFLWALWKLGLLGVLFWLVPLGLCTYYFLKVPKNTDYQLACAFYFGTLLVYLQTMTNPYLNNPIGLSFVMVALFSLRTLGRAEMAVPAAQPVAALPAGGPVP